MIGMRIFRICFFCLAMVSIIPSVLAAASSFPKQTGYINDFAAVIRPEVRVRMEIVARELAQKTGAEVAVVTIKSTGDMDYNEYANLLYQEWGIGQKETDEGVLILNAVEDRTIRIEVGYGLEGLIPDGLAGQIRDEMIPYLREGNPTEGLFRGMVTIIGIVAKDKGVEITGAVNPQRRSGGSSRRGSGYAGFLSIILFIFFF